jgi:O-antigen/teichoic acid export membrane protein
VRLVLLTEQTRDWEHGRAASVLRGLRRYSLGAAGVALVSVPVFLLAMPWLVRVVFGSEFIPAVDAARIVLVSAAILLVLGWTKSFPVTIGRPRLRIVTHGLETIVLLPLIVVLGDRWGVTGAAVAILVSTLVFAAAWIVVLGRLRTELRTGRGIGAPTAAGP